MLDLKGGDSMAQWTKFNNPSKKRRRRRMSRTDADIIAAKMMFDNMQRGIDLPLSFYDAASDKMCGKPSRNIYKEGE